MDHGRIRSRIRFQVFYYMRLNLACQAEVAIASRPMGRVQTPSLQLAGFEQAPPVIREEIPLDFCWKLVRMGPRLYHRMGSAMEPSDQRRRNTPTFDFIVLLGMVANLILAVFLILYYFGLF
jgi:hypothetical protein